MRRSTLLFAIVLVAACSGGDDGAVTTTSPGSSSSASTTTAAPATTSSTLPPQTPLASGEEAVGALLAAWQAGDRAAALLVASAPAVDTLFAIVPEPAAARGCNQGNINVTISCVFGLSVGTLQVRAAPTADGTGFLVDFVILGS